MRVYLASLVQVILGLIPVAILMFFIWAAIRVIKQLDRIEALLLKDRRLTYEQKESG